MRYFVTGATGFIGRWVARQLGEQGHEVVSVARNPEKTRLVGEMGVEMLRGDVTDKESLREPMRGVDGVFHIAGWYKLGPRSKAEIESANHINVDGTRNVMEMVRELKIPKCVFTSTLAVFSDTKGKVVNETYRHRGPWLSVYDQTKWKAHYEVVEKMQQEHVPIVIVQPGVVYGPGDLSGIRGLFIAYLRRRLVTAPQKTAFCWGHVEDTARGHLLAMEKGKIGESYIIAGEPHTIIEALEIAQKITGIKPPRLHPGPLPLKILSGLMSVAGYLVKLPEAYTGEGLRIAAGVTCLGSNEKAKRDLGFAPRTLEAGLREVLAFERAELKRDLTQ